MDGYEYEPCPVWSHNGIKIYSIDNYWKGFVLRREFECIDENGEWWKVKMAWEDNGQRMLPIFEKSEKVC